MCFVKKKIFIERNKKVIIMTIKLFNISQLYSITQFLRPNFCEVIYNEWVYIDFIFLLKYRQRK